MNSGEWTCHICADITNRSREVKERYANRGRTRVDDLDYVPKEKKILNFAEMFDETPIIFPESIARLERMLLTATQGRV